MIIASIGIRSSNVSNEFFVFVFLGHCRKLQDWINFVLNCDNRNQILQYNYDENIPATNYL